MDERYLAIAVHTGQVADFNRLIEAHQDMIYSVAYRLLGQADGATQATEEAFLTAYRALPAYRGGAFHIWLFRILIRECHGRSSRKRIGTTAPPKHSGGQKGETDTTQVIAAGICSLPWEQRVTLVLADVQGLSYEQVAQVTGTYVGSVKSRLSRARTRLGHYLQEGAGAACHSTGGRSQCGGRDEKHSCA
jgi:RNA polymerase sigma factor (sigma-70 family)